MIRREKDKIMACSGLVGAGGLGKARTPVEVAWTMLTKIPLFRSSLLKHFMSDAFEPSQEREKKLR